MPDHDALLRECKNMRKEMRALLNLLSKAKPMLDSTGMKAEAGKISPADVDQMESAIDAAVARNTWVFHVQEPT